VFPSKATFIIFSPFRIVSLDVSKMIPTELVDGFFDFSKIEVNNVRLVFKNETYIIPPSSRMAFVEKLV
jgi:hypothetical protein